MGVLIGTGSSKAHRGDPLWSVTVGDLWSLLNWFLLADLLCECCHHVVPHRGDVERSDQAQGPGERPSLLGQVDAPEVEVHAGPATRQPAGGIGGESAPRSDDTQQVRLRRLAPAAHARALRAREASRPRAYRLRGARLHTAAPALRPTVPAPRLPTVPALRVPALRLPVATGHPAGWPSVSLWMSMRQPVSRAASRAF